MELDLAELRRVYRDRGLDVADLAPTWLEQLRSWVLAAVEAGLREPNAMVLGTVGSDGRPSARTVLLKHLTEQGLVFFTNYTSRKGRELTGQPAVSLVFPWVELERQVVVTGTCTRTSREESAAYFARRPRGSQLGAWASEQSHPVPDRALLEERLAEVSERFPNEVPVPPWWGGVRVAPDSVEFWQGRPDRLHDRLRYRLDGERWLVERLSP